MSGSDTGAGSEYQAGFASDQKLRTISTWTAPVEVSVGPDAKSEKFSEELLLSFDRGRERRVLIVPAMFDEANKMRRFTVQTMRAADELGLDTFLPDLPGCNDSLVPLEYQTLASWRVGVEAAVKAFGITHVLAIRAGALIAPSTLPICHYAPLSGPKVLRAMIRARTIAAREAGREETSEQLSEQARKSGLMLAGWTIGAQMFCELEEAEPCAQGTIIAPKDLGASGLWLRAEPDEDTATSHKLAGALAGDFGASA